VVGIGEFGIEVSDYLLGRSTDCQGNVSTRGGGAEGQRAMTNEGRAGVFATEAKEGGAGCEAGAGAGAVGGWAWGLGVGRAEGFFAVAALGGDPEPLTLSVSSLTWPVLQTDDKDTYLMVMTTWVSGT